MDRDRKQRCAANVRRIASKLADGIGTCCGRRLYCRRDICFCFRVGSRSLGLSLSRYPFVYRSAILDVPGWISVASVWIDNGVEESIDSLIAINSRLRSLRTLIVNREQRSSFHLSGSRGCDERFIFRIFQFRCQ